MYEDEKLMKSNSPGTSKPDCKGSLFHGLRKVDPDVLSQMFSNVINGDLKLTQLNQCHDVKVLQDLKKHL